MHCPSKIKGHHGIGSCDSLHIQYTLDIIPFLLMLKSLREKWTKLAYGSFLDGAGYHGLHFIAGLVLSDVRSDVFRRAVMHVHAPRLRQLRLCRIEDVGEDLWSVLADESPDSRIKAERDGSPRFHFPQLTEVVVENTSFDVESLTHLVAVRNTASFRPFSHCYAIHALEVHDCGVISVDHRMWLDTNVPELVWD